MRFRTSGTVNEATGRRVETFWRTSWGKGEVQNKQCLHGDAACVTVSVQVGFSAFGPPNNSPVPIPVSYNRPRKTCGEGDEYDSSHGYSSHVCSPSGSVGCDCSLPYLHIYSLAEPDHVSRLPTNLTQALALELHYQHPFTLR